MPPDLQARVSLCRGGAVTECYNDLMDKVRTVLYGIGAALASWAVMIAADAFDEKILDKSTLTGGIAYFAVPAIMLIVYIIHCNKRNPAASGLALWHAGFIGAFVPVWIYVYDSVNYNRFFVEQVKRGSFIDLNGLELMFYGITALAAFTAACGIYRLIRLGLSKRVTRSAR